MLSVLITQRKVKRSSNIRLTLDWRIKFVLQLQTTCHFCLATK